MTTKQLLDMSERNDDHSQPENEESLGQKVVAELKQLCRERGLRVTGAKSVLIARLLDGDEQEQQQSTPQIPLEIDQHIIDMGHGEIERDRLERKRGLLRAMKVAQLQSILKARGQKISGNKESLIIRLLGLEKKKLKNIEKSCVPKLLMKDIFEGNDLQEYDGSPMEAEALYHSREQYRRYPLEQFAELLVKKREEYAENMEHANHIDKLVMEQLESIGGMAETTQGGYLSWRVHPAKELLRQDMERGLHKSMSPALLFSTREEYKTLHADVSMALKIFRKRIAQEELRTKQNNWNHKKAQKDDNDSRAEEAPDEWSENEGPVLEDDDLVSESD